MSEPVRNWCRRTMKLVNKIGYLAKKIDEYDEDFYEVRENHRHSEWYLERIDKCYDEFQKALKLLNPQAGGRRLTTEGAGGRRKAKSNRKTRRSRK